MPGDIWPKNFFRNFGEARAPLLPIFYACGSIISLIRAAVSTHQMLKLNLSLTAAKLCAVMISAPSLGVYFVVDSVCLSVCHGQTSNWFFFFCFSMESSHFWPSVRAGLRYCGALSTWQSRCPFHWLGLGWGALAPVWRSGGRNFSKIVKIVLFSAFLQAEMVSSAVG